MATYKVKKGDTLSAIAKQLGTSIDQLSGYRSGDPNKIFEGETITVGSGNAQNTAQERASAIGTAFGSNEGQNSTTATTEAPKRSFQADSVYDTAGYTSQAQSAKAKKEEAFGKLQNFETTRYNEEFDKSGLKDTKEKISQKDNEIAEAKKVLNESLAKVRSNPGASAATITGEVSVIQDKLGNQINNLIAERNSLADSYNTGVAEIKDKVKTEMSDLEKEYNFYAQQEQEANAFLKAYQDAILEELQSEGAQQFQLSRDDAQFARDLQLAREKTSSSGGSSGLTPYQTFQATQSLKKTNQSNVAAATELKRQTDIINSTWNRLASGQAKDLNATSQAIITTFNKILDPTSVVRESEYDRTGAGQALLSTIQGKIAAISQGGPGLTRESLKELVDLGNTYAKNAQAYIDASNERAREEASFFGLNPDFIVSTQIKPDVTPSGITYQVETPAPQTTSSGSGGVLSSVSNWLKGLFK